MRRLKRRTVVTAGVVCGIVLAWALSPILNSRHTADATVRVVWPPGQTAGDRYYKELVKEAHEYARVALSSNATQPQHFQGIGFSPWRKGEVTFFITTEDRHLSQTAVRETVAHMGEWSAEFPGGPKLTVVDSVWNDLPRAPDFPVGAAGVVCGLLAGWIMAASLPPE
jgi:hypothetical protein